jgi:hypothetical protein
MLRDDLKAELVLDALGMAVTARAGDAAGFVAHSDHGSQPGFKEPPQRCRFTGRIPCRRMSRLPGCWYADGRSVLAVLDISASALQAARERVSDLGP